MKNIITSKKTFIFLLIIIFSGLIIYSIIINNQSIISNPVIEHSSMVEYDNHFSSYLLKYQDDELINGEKKEIKPTDFILEDGETLNQEGSYRWVKDKSVSFLVDNQEAGLYYISLDYLSLIDGVLPIKLSLYINNESEVPYFEASQMTLATLWQEAGEVGVDRYGNDVNIVQKPYDKWQNSFLKDASRLVEDGLCFYLNAGINKITLINLNGELLLGKIAIATKPQYPTYEEYLASFQQLKPALLLRQEAELMLYKNSSTISMGINRDVGVLPFSLTKLKLNVIGIDSYFKPGEAVTWKVDIEEEGLYHLTFKVLQTLDNTTFYRTLYVNGKIPFEEAKHLPFSYNAKWQNITLNQHDKKFLFYLKPNDEITLEVDSTLYQNPSLKLKKVTNEMTQLGLDITKLTRNNTDKGIDWQMLDYFPDLELTLERWVEELNDVISILKKLGGFNKDSQAIQDIKAAIAKIVKIKKNINELPRQLVLLSVGSSCAVQLLASQIDNILNQPLIIDAFYLHDEKTVLPNAKASFLKKLQVSVSRFFMSFFDTSYSEKAKEDELEIWVNRPRQYVDLLQKISDDIFTSKYKIKVKVSIMSDDGKLLLANSANRQPDVALGVSAWIPVEFGMRGMLYDLSKQSDLKEVIDVFHPEQLVPMIYQNGLYGIPETENFYCLFYRRDIFDQLNLSVPETWDDVIALLPVLDRYGMSFYLPLSSSSAAKSFDTTTPFIHQFNGKIYDAGFLAGVDHENTIAALTFMTDLYREYSIPRQVSSFFNDFRQTRIPIGIADFGTYLQLVNAAAEISGLWEISVVPGYEFEENGQKVINRFMPGAQQAGIIFNKSKKINEAWTYLKWWMSTDVQILFSQTIVNTLGSRYLWNSANIEAFKSFNWPEEHKTVILKQWESLKEVPKIPGYYIIERELSNTWNKVVYDDVNLRSAINDAIIKMNKEIKRKMQEFGYLDNQGNEIKPFIIPTSDIVKGWLSEKTSNKDT